MRHERGDLVYCSDRCRVAAQRAAGARWWKQNGAEYQRERREREAAK
jgi:hypothetical protein